MLNIIAYTKYIVILIYLFLLLRSYSASTSFKNFVSMNALTMNVIHLNMSNTNARNRKPIDIEMNERNTLLYISLSSLFVVKNLASCIERVII